MFTDGKPPDDLDDSAFIRVVDKTKTDDLLAAIESVIETGIPTIARKLHDDLDRAGVSYLWSFLESNWNELEVAGLTDHGVLERILRRRAALQISRLDPDAETPTELLQIDAAEVYIYPPVPGVELRLGTILRDKTSKEFRVTLTPHCHLVPQPGSSKPRAEQVLTVEARPFMTALQELYGEANPWDANPDQNVEQISQRTRWPAGRMKGAAAGRFCYLPRFLDIPHLLCDFQSVKSLTLVEVGDSYESVAVLDAPFAEAIQSLFTSFYSAVGLPEIGALNPP